MNRDEAFGAIIDVLKNIPDLNCKMPLDKLTPETSFRGQMGFDSLAQVSLFYELQDKYPYLNEVSAVKWKTLNDCIESLLAK